MIEFVALTLLFMVPLIYLVLAFARVQAGSFAAEAAAASSSRAAVVAGVEASEEGLSSSQALAVAGRRASAAVALAAGDFGIPEDRVALELDCEGSCLDPGTNVVSTVTVTVPLPGLPGFLAGAFPLEVEVQSHSRSPVDSVVVDS